MANRIDHATLIRYYCKLRALDWDYVKNRRENIDKQMDRIVTACALEGISRDDLEAAWQEWRAWQEERK